MKKRELTAITHPLVDNSSSHLSPTHRIVLNAIDKFSLPIIDISEILDMAVQAVADLHPRRFSKNSRLPSCSQKQKDQSVFNLRQSYEKSPKETVRRLLPNFTPTSLPSINDILDHFICKPPPPISQDFLSDFPSYPDKETCLPITVHEINQAFSLVSKSSPGNDKILYNDWREIDPHRLFLKEVFNHILLTNNIPRQWKFFRTKLLLKPMKDNVSHHISSWRPIAIMDTSYRIFSTIINLRLLRWVSEGNLLSRNQKALLS